MNTELLDLTIRELARRVEDLEIEVRALRLRACSYPIYHYHYEPVLTQPTIVPSPGTLMPTIYPTYGPPAAPTYPHYGPHGTNTE